MMPEGRDALVLMGREATYVRKLASEPETRDYPYR
jgi:hypothetical protein